MADLITVEEYRLAEGIESTKADTRLQSLVTSTSQLVKTYCANSFVDYYDTDKVEQYTIQWATNAIQLTESPVVSITTVEERTTYGGSYTELSTADKEYYLDTFTDTLYRTSESGFAYWPQGPGSVQVTYKAGYADIPEDLKLAVIDLITYYYKDEYKERRTIGAASIANVPSSTQWRNVGFPDHIKRVLDLYKQVYM